MGFEVCDLLSHADIQVSAEIAKQEENEEQKLFQSISSVHSILGFPLSVDIQTVQLKF